MIIDGSVHMRLSRAARQMAAYGLVAIVGAVSGGAIVRAYPGPPWPQDEPTPAPVATMADNLGTEAYDLCSPETLADNCVVLSDPNNPVWLTRAANGQFVAVAFSACESDDGPAPCIWDTQRGNGSAGLDIPRFIVIRD